MSDEVVHISRSRFNVMRPPRLLIVVAIIIALASLGVGGYFYNQYQSNLPQNIAKKNQAEARHLADEVGKFMLLPTDETPTVATITDITKLNSQQFFKYAKNGDKVLIYAKAQIAIVYNPNLHKIINVGPVNVGAQPNQAPQAKIAIRNGTNTPGLAAKEQINIQQSFPGATIVSTDQASSTDYAKTIIIALNPIAKNAADTLAKFYNATVTALPSTESPQDGVDILIILGRDRSTAATPSASLAPVLKK